MYPFLKIRAARSCALAILVLPGPVLAADGPAQSREANTPRIGKYQMMEVVPKGAGGQSSDTHEAWILDTETGRVAICGGYSGVCRFIDPKAPAK